MAKQKKVVWFLLCDELDSRKGILPNGRMQDELPGRIYQSWNLTYLCPATDKYKRTKGFQGNLSNNFTLTSHRNRTDRQNKE